MMSDQEIISRVLGQLHVYWKGFGDGIKIEIVAPDNQAISDLIIEAAEIRPAYEDREFSDEQYDRLSDLQSELATEIKRRLQGVM